jgi:hypothetical protein
MYYGGFSYIEGYNMPIVMKQWWIERINKEINKNGDDGGARTRAAHQNSPDVRALQGMTNPHAPTRTRRFT